MAITVDKKGRRYYLRGTPYAAKDALRNGGCRWDPQEKAWWTGKGEVAERIAGALEAAPVASKEPARGKAPDETIDEHAKVILGKVTYKGKSYYMLAVRRDRAGCKVCFKDGSAVFWTKPGVPFDMVEYQNARSIAELRAFAEQRKSGASRVNGGGAGGGFDSGDDSAVTMPISRPQDAERFYVGEVLAVLMSEAGVEKLEQAQGIQAVDIPPAITERHKGHRRVACKVVRAWSYTDDEVEDLDAWSHKHEANVQLASAEDGESLRQSRQRALDEQDAARRALAQAREAFDEQAAKLAQTMVGSESLTLHGVGDALGLDAGPREMVVSYDKRTIYRASLGDHEVFIDDRQLYDDWRCKIWMPEELFRRAIQAAGERKAEAAKDGELQESVEKYSGCVGHDVVLAALGRIDDAVAWAKGGRS